METDPTLEFEYFLAQKLGRTVAELRQMGNDEFVGWQVFYSRKAQDEQLEMQKAKGG
jgi:hypothetical protein